MENTNPQISLIWPEYSQDEVMEKLKGISGAYSRYLALDKLWQERMLAFMQGKKTLPLTYDPFFKKLFNPDVYPERLSAMLSAIIGRKIKVLKMLPSEDSMMDGNTLLIMDILVELEDKSLVDIEIQKIPYYFPAERMSCYSSDVLMRQYMRVKGERGKAFTYKDIKKVYTVVFFEDSTATFREKGLNGAYAHHGKTVFDTGLNVELLQEYYLIALDVFKDSRYARDINERNGWISLLATESAADAKQLCRMYPWLEPIYADMAGYMERPEEVLGMYSEALRILDENTIKFMVDDMREQIAKKDKVIQERDKEIRDKDKAIQDKSKALQDKDKVIQDKDKLITELRRQLGQEL